MFGITASGETEGGGQFRICDLVEGDYRIFLTKPTEDNDSKPFFREVSFRITDRDVEDAVFIVDELLRIPVEALWAEGAPEDPPEISVTVSRWPLFRAGYSGDGESARSPLPGKGEFADVFPGAYKIRARAQGQTNPIYVQDIRYGDNSVLHAPFVAGSEPAGTVLRVIFGHDTSSTSVRVLDGNKRPVSDVYVHLIPAGVKDEADLATRKQSQQSDQNGTARFDKDLAPGAYYAVATEDEVFDTPEEVRALWVARSRAPLVNAPPKGSVETAVTLDAGR
jgi:hypothetical protein